MAMEVWRVVPDAHGEPMMCVACNRARSELYSGGQDGLVKLWDLDTGKLLRVQAGHRGWVTGLLWVPALQTLFSGSVDGTVVAWGRKGKEVQAVDTGGPVFCLAWDQKRKQVVVGGNGQVLLFRASALSGAGERQGGGGDFGHDGPGSGATRGPGGREGGFHGGKGPSDGPGGAHQHKVLRLHTAVKCHGDIVRGVCVSDAGEVFSVGYDKSICLFDSERPRETLVRFEGCHAGAICSVAFDADNNWLITGSYDGVVKIWSQEGRFLDSFEGLSDTITGVCYVPATRHYWMTGKGRRIMAFDPSTPINVTQYIKETACFDDFAVQKLDQVPGTDTVVGVTTSRQLVVWQYNPRAAARVLCAHTDWIEGMCIVRARSEHGEGEISVFSAGAEGSVLRWGLNPQLNTDWFLSQDEELYGHEGAILCLVYAPQIHAVLTGSDDCTIRVWYLDDQGGASGSGGALPEAGVSATATVDRGNPGDDSQHILALHEARVNALALAGDEVLVSVSQDQSLAFWDLHTKHVIEHVVDAHDTSIQGVAYAPGRDEVATCGIEETVKVWCTLRHELKYLLKGHPQVVSHVAWCDFLGGRWVTASEDESLRMWDGPEQEIMVGYSGDAVTALYVDEENEVIVAAMEDRCLRVYDPRAPAGSQLVKKYLGHTDVVRSIEYVAEKRQYLTCSWDKSIRVWFASQGDAAANNADTATSAKDALAADAELEDEANFVSEYEKEHPLVMPKALRNTSSIPIKLSSTKTARSKKTHSQMEAAMLDTRSGNFAQPPPPEGSLEHKLQELEERLAPKITLKEELAARDQGARRRSGMVSPSMLRNLKKEVYARKKR